MSATIAGMHPISGTNSHFRKTLFDFVIFVLFAIFSFFLSMLLVSLLWPPNGSWHLYGGLWGQWYSHFRMFLGLFFCPLVFPIFISFSQKLNTKYFVLKVIFKSTSLVFITTIIYFVILASTCAREIPALGCSADPIPLMSLPFFFGVVNLPLTILSSIFIGLIVVLLRKRIIFLKRITVMQITTILLVATIFIAPIAYFSYRQSTQTIHLPAGWLEYSEPSYGINFLYPAGATLFTLLYSFEDWWISKTHLVQFEIIDSISITRGDEDPSTIDNIDIDIYPLETEAENLINNLVNTLNSRYKIRDENKLFLQQKSATILGGQKADMYIYKNNNQQTKIYIPIKHKNYLLIFGINVARDYKRYKIQNDILSSVKLN